MKTHEPARPEPPAAASKGLAAYLVSVVPTLVVLGGLVALGYWGYRNEWKLPGGETPPADAAEHEVKVTGGPGPDSAAWCEQHGLPLAQCTVCHPETAIKGEVPPPSADEPRVRRDSSEKPDPRTCQTHLLSVQFPSAESMDRAGIRFAAVREAAVAQHVTAPGRLDYDQTRLAHLAPRVAGTVWRVDKQVGQPVKKGEVLALIEAFEVGKAKADFLQALITLDTRSRQLARLKEAGAAVPERQVRDADSSLRTARIQLFNSQQALANLGLPLRMDDVQGLGDEETARKLRLLGLPPDVQATLNPDIATANLLPLLAPFDGVVIGRDMVTGEPANPMQTHLTVADTHRLTIVIDVRQEDAGRLALGQPVAFYPDATPGDPIQGKVTMISTEVDPKTRTVQVRAEADNPGGRFRANSFGTGRILVRETPRAVVVPNEALQWEGCCHVAFVRTANDRVQVRKVRPGFQEAGVTEVLAGLVPGEVVATAGSHMLKSEILKSKIGGEE